MSFKGEQKPTPEKKDPIERSIEVCEKLQEKIRVFLTFFPEDSFDSERGSLIYTKGGAEVMALQMVSVFSSATYTPLGTKLQQELENIKNKNAANIEITNLVEKIKLPLSEIQEILWTIDSRKEDLTETLQEHMKSVLEERSTTRGHLHVLEALYSTSLKLRENFEDVVPSLKKLEKLTSQSK